MCQELQVSRLDSLLVSPALQVVIDLEQLV